MKNTILIQEDNFDIARKKIKENAGKIIIFSSDKDEVNRKILEKEKINILLLNQAKRKDRQKQRNSGLNQVLARLAKKNDITIGINLDEIMNAKEKNKAEILARIKQNIMLCNKNKLKMEFISPSKWAGVDRVAGRAFARDSLKTKTSESGSWGAGNNKKDTHGLKALGLVLGMPTWMTKKL